MTNFTHKGGRFIVQGDRKKGSESTYLNFFIQTFEGKKWLDKNNITKATPEESPDFIFETSTGKTIGLEITELFLKTDKFQATSTLQTIAKQVCRHFKKEKGIALSLIIDIWDERKWNANWSDHIDYRNNPGFERLEVPKKKIKDAIIAAISKEDIPAFGHNKLWIELPPHKFIIDCNRMHEPHTSTFVNNAGMSEEDPFEELQEGINGKNEKYATYKTRCDECDLLVISDGSSRGSYVNFSNKINSHKFFSSFKNVYLLDFGMDGAKTIKLNTGSI